MNGLKNEYLIEMTRGELITIKTALESLAKVLENEDISYSDVESSEVEEAIEIIDSLLYKDEYNKEDL